MHKLRDAPGEIEAGLRAELESIAGQRRVYVLGLGYLDKADDGAGVLVAQALKKLFPSYSYSEHDGVEGTVLDISEKKEDATVFFVDAADLHEAPGTVRVVRKDEINDREITTHRVAVALMAAILERAGKGCGVICIQPGTIAFRAEVSGPVKETIERLTVVLSHLMRIRD